MTPANGDALESRDARIVEHGPSRESALHEQCEEGRSLLCSYLVALTKVEILTVRHSNPQEMRHAQDELNELRTLYWQHVDDHKCRKDKRRKLTDSWPAAIPSLNRHGVAQARSASVRATPGADSCDVGKGNATNRRIGVQA